MSYLKNFADASFHKKVKLQGDVSVVRASKLHELPLVPDFMPCLTSLQFKVYIDGHCSGQR